MLRTIAASPLCLAATSYVEPQSAYAADGAGNCPGKLIDYVPYQARDRSRIGQL